MWKEKNDTYEKNVELYFIQGVIKDSEKSPGKLKQTNPTYYLEIDIRMECLLLFIFISTFFFTSIVKG